MQDLSIFICCVCYIKLSKAVHKYWTQVYRALKSFPKRGYYTGNIIFLTLNRDYTKAH